MIRSIAAAGPALIVATSAHAMTPAPIPQANRITTQIAYRCGPFMTRINGSLAPQRSLAISSASCEPASQPGFRHTAIGRSLSNCACSPRVPSRKCELMSVH